VQLEFIFIYLIKHSVISGQGWILSGQEAEHSEPILDGDKHDVVVVQDVVGLVLGRRPADEVAAVDPDDDRTVLADDQVPGEDVQPEAILVPCGSRVKSDGAT